MGVCGGSGEVVGFRGKENSFVSNWRMDDDLGVGLFLYTVVFIIPNPSRGDKGAVIRTVWPLTVKVAGHIHTGRSAAGNLG